MGGRERLATDFPHLLGSRARVLAKQEEAAAAAGKVGVAPLPPTCLEPADPSQDLGEVAASRLGGGSCRCPPPGLGPGQWEDEPEQGSPVSRACPHPTPPLPPATSCSLSVLSLGQEEG